MLSAWCCRTLPCTSNTIASHLHGKLLSACFLWANMAMTCIPRSSTRYYPHMSPMPGHLGDWSSLQSSPSHNQLLYHPHMQPIQAVGRSWACRLTQLTLCTGKDTPCRCGHLAWRVQAVGTFGFRGEALSSLCALADVSVVTRCKEALLGQKLSYDHAGRLGQQSPTARAPGTTVTAKQLFHNLPVRHKVSTCCARSVWAASEHATSLVGWGSRAPGPLALAAVSLSSSSFTMCLCGTSRADRLKALVG